MLSGFVQQKDASQLATRASKQIYIALWFLLETAALLQIDACPMEWFNPARFDEILGLEGLGLASVVACPIGYRSADDKYAQIAKVRFASDAIVHRI
jgi:nitroreductase